MLTTPWDSLASVAAERYPIFPVSWMLHDTFDSVAAVSRYGGPLIIVGAQLDTLIPVVRARRFASEHAQAQLMLLAGAHHDDWFGAMTRQDWHQVLVWILAA